MKGKQVVYVEKSQKKFFSSDAVANIIGFIIVLFTLGVFLILEEDFLALKYPSWKGLGSLAGNIFSIEFLKDFLLTGFFLALVFGLFYRLMGKGNISEFLKAFVFLYILASIVYIISSEESLKKYLEYAFWALLIGLVVNNVFGLPNWAKPALMSDFYVKVGLVLMGSEVIFSNIASFGAYGIAISWIVVPIVIIFMWYFGVHYLKMESPTMVMVIAVATSVCGVSAAVAAAASIKADKHDLTFAVGISIVFTIVMMVFMPLFIQAVGMDEMVGGAWIGNTVDSTGAVVLAGEALGPLASQVAAMVKMIQNVLIGFVSVAIAIFFANREGSSKNNTGIRDIWTKIPKFILGFIAMSAIFSFIIQPSLGQDLTNNLISNISSWKGWAFCLTFLCIGLETNFRELKDNIDEGKPVTLYVVGQLFSLVLSLFVCWLVLSGNLIPRPELVI